MASKQNHGWLIVLSDGEPGDRQALEGGEIYIGRTSACQVQLKDPKVSRSHARISRQSNQLVIEDLQSSHGVLVNGQKITKIALQDGDRIQLGDTQLRVELSPDAIGTVMAPPGEQVLAHAACRYCESSIASDEVYCGTCGAITRELPEPFGFIQQAYLQIRALHQAGKMDAMTFRTELEKMVVSDGLGGYWMVGVQSGRWHWYNGREWIPREPPSTPLKKSPPLESQAPSPPPPVPPPPEPGVREVEEAQSTRRLFLIGGGTLVAFSILAVGAYTAYQLVNQNGETPISAVEDQPQTMNTIAGPLPTQTTAEMVDTPASTPTASSVPLPTEAPALPYRVRSYDPGTDEALSRLADFVVYLETDSTPEHSIYEGEWYVQRPAIFSIGWCAIDEATLDQNLQDIQMLLEVDGRVVEPELMFEEGFTDPDLACWTSRIVLEFLEPGEYRLNWTTSYPEPVFDGWETLEAGIYRTDYIFDVTNATAIEDEFDESSGRWDEGVQENFSLWTEDGSFHIQVHKENFAAWSIYHDLAVRDVFIITHANRVSTAGGSYGLIARYQDVSNFYYFIIDDSGYFTLGKRFAGEYIALIDWTATEAIMSGDGLNSLGITISGNGLVAFINSQMVGTVSDDSFAEGGVGMFTQTDPEMAEMHASFDLFFVEYYE